MLEHVFRPASVGPLRLRHRIMMGSMHLNLETADDGAALAAFYVERVRGGADLVVTGGIAVNRAGAGGRTYALLDRPGDGARLARVAAAVHAAGGHIALQLFHAGRYAFPDAFGITPLAPSAIYSRFSHCLPQAMDEADIAATIAAFAAGARVAVDAGFDAVEVMGSEGYLLNQFASPVTNQRTDGWGGSAASRRRFPVAVVAAVRDAVGTHFPVIARTSGADLVPDSSTPDEHDALALALAEAGADAINVGIGWHESRVPTVQSLVPHGMWIDVAERVRRALRAAGRTVPVIGSNRVNSLAQAEEFLAGERVDMISMARPFLADPAIIAKARAGHPELVNRCTGCNVCIDLSITDRRVTCMVNPRAGHEVEFPAPPAARVHRKVAPVAVVGAGPAGMQAALTLAQHGLAVDLFEADSGIGGQFRCARIVPGKADYGATVDYFAHELARLGVRIRTSSRAGAADLGHYAHVIAACGVTPRRVDLPGMASAHVLSYRAAFDRPQDVGRRVAVIGAGGIAVDLAEFLVNGEGSELDGDAARRRYARTYGLDGAPPAVAAPRREVTIMRRTGRIGAGIGPSTRWAVVASIRARGVRTLTGVRYLRASAAGLWIQPPAEAGAAAAGEALIAADTVIVAAGQLPDTRLAAALAAAGIPHTVVGGARDAERLTAVRAFAEGLRAATEVAASLGASRAGA